MKVCVCVCACVCVCVCVCVRVLQLGEVAPCYTALLMMLLFPGVSVVQEHEM